MPVRPVAIALLSTLLLFGCSTTSTTSTAPKTQAAAEATPPFSPGHDGTLWVQTSGEYRAAALQAFAHAQDQLEAALADPTWTAAVEQGAEAAAGLPPAIVVDVDETVLDNVPFQARLALAKEGFSREAWNDWVTEASAEPLPGAKAFLDAAAAKGVTVFYVTNRNAKLEEATRKNLEQVGFPLDASRDTLFTRDERSDWGSDKTTRRQEVAKTHRILLLLGDDLNDFTSGVRDVPPEDRRAVADSHEDRWGRQWILLPNPLYGSWERSLVLGTDGLSLTEAARHKERHLDPGRD